MDLLSEMDAGLPDKTAPERVRMPVLEEPKEEDIDIDGLIQLTGGNSNELMARHERLSRALHTASLADEEMLRRVHNRKYHRLTKLIERDVNRAGEYELLRRYILKSPFTKWLIAVEYELDDGCREQGHGDAIFYDGLKLYAVECKRTRGDSVREVAVRRQASKYASRLKSWLAHLGHSDEALARMSHAEVVAAIVTDDAKLRVVESVRSEQQ